MFGLYIAKKLWIKFENLKKISRPVAFSLKTDSWNIAAVVCFYNETRQETLMDFGKRFANSIRHVADVSDHRLANASDISHMGHC